METLFSIILPTYNRAYVLWRAIQSVLVQTEVRWELIVVDDGSTDDTLRLLEEFRDPRIRKFTLNHQGVSAARNFGVRRAISPYVAYLDSDNVWHADFLSTMLVHINLHRDGLLWYCGQNTTIWKRSVDGEWLFDKAQVDTRAQYRLDEVLQLQGADANCMVHPRGLFDEIGGWDEACAFLEDWDLFARCKTQHPERVWWVPKVLVEYRQVYGENVDGLCATAMQDPDMKHAQWKYLVDKWRGQAGFEATAERLTRKYLV